ncbi:MAG: hypothetical protein PHH11_15875, partial [Methylomonas sp.]|nr:hypothetical protein [Methylomonas sp.]
KRCATTVRTLVLRANSGKFFAPWTVALDSLKAVLGDAVAMVMETIDAHIQCWFVQVLQLDARALRLEALEINDDPALCRS